jgi:hypothetical protein
LCRSRRARASERADDVRVDGDALARRRLLDGLLEAFGQAERDPRGEGLVGRRRRRLGLVADVHELRVLAGQPHLDMTGRKLVVQLLRRFRQRVEEAQTDGSLEREDEASGRVGRRLVTQLRDRRQVGLERVDESL